MTRSEAAQWLHAIQWHFADLGNLTTQGIASDAHFNVRMGMSPALLREWSYYILANGKRGHVTLVLHSRYEARAMALIVGILRSVEDSGACLA